MLFACHPIWTNNNELGVDRKGIAAYKISEEFLWTSLQSYFRLGWDEGTREMGTVQTKSPGPTQNISIREECA